MKGADLHCRPGVSSTGGCHERRTLLSLAHFLIIRMMYSTWGFPEFRRRVSTSLSVSLESKQDMRGNKIRSRTNNLSCLLSLNRTPIPAHSTTIKKKHHHTGKRHKHTWTPCLPGWAGRCRHTPLFCPPSSWRLGPASPVHRTPLLHSRTDPSETSVPTSC